VFIRGSIMNGAFTIASTEADVVGDYIELDWATSSGTFSGVNYYDPNGENPFYIDWEISIDGAPFVLAGSSTHPIFVTIDTPVNSGVTPYHTTLYLACASGGDTTNPTDAASYTWALMSGRTVCKYNPATGNFDIPLYYYKPGTTFSENPAGGPGSYGDGAKNLLGAANHTGQCSTWASLLADAWSINGNVDGTDWLYKQSDPPSNYGRLWVKNWSFHGYGDFVFDNTLPDMVPEPARYYYGALTNDIGIPGQNDNPPSQKVFANHQFLYRVSTDSFYDPSYGVIYADEQTFWDGCYGFGNYGSLVGSHYVCYFSHKNT
jgi:hypothetical protein